MDWIEIDSTDIEAIKYVRGYLYVRFKRKAKGLTRTYMYQGVPYAKVQALVKAESPGNYFNANIRNKYKYVERRGIK